MQARNRTIIRTAFLGVVVLLVLQFAFIRYVLEPYPALLMPKFTGSPEDKEWVWLDNFTLTAVMEDGDTLQLQPWEVLPMVDNNTARFAILGLRSTRTSGVSTRFSVWNKQVSLRIGERDRMEDWDAFIDRVLLGLEEQFAGHGKVERLTIGYFKMKYWFDSRTFTDVEKTEELVVNTLFD